MPAPVVTAELVLNAIKARIDLITTAGGNYNTSPVTNIGTPRDAVAEGVGESLYLVHHSSEGQFDAAGTMYRERATYNLWAVSRDPITGQNVGLRLCRDVQKAIRSGYQA